MSTDMHIANRGLLEDQIGFETIGRAAQILLFERLNENILHEQERWRLEDIRFQELGLTPGIGDIDLELVEPENFHEGPHKSVLEAPPDAFPCISVMAYYMQQDAEQWDQFDSYGMRLYVETLVKAGPVPEDAEISYETIVHRRIQRTTEAVHATFMSDRKLRGTVNDLSTQPRGGIADSSWVRRESKGQGPRYLWQGSRLEYSLQRLAKF